MDHFADRLLDAIDKKHVPACVGLDPLLHRLPPTILAHHGIDTDAQGNPSSSTTHAAAAAEALVEFGSDVIEIVAECVPAIKINIAFFEPFYASGIHAYHRLVRIAHESGLLVIGDVKRADIGPTSMQYARAQLGGGPLDDKEFPPPDAVTVNAYFGSDGVQPFLDVARETGRGVFVLVQTSNESAASIQGLPLVDGGTVCQKVGELVQSWAVEPSLLGVRGYSSVGAVVSPRDIPSTERIRKLMPNCLFLVPGFGAQGRTAREVAKCFKSDGTGAIVTASRSVIYATPNNLKTEDQDWRTCVRDACRNFVAQIREVSRE